MLNIWNSLGNISGMDLTLVVIAAFTLHFRESVCVEYPMWETLVKLLRIKWCIVLILRLQHNAVNTDCHHHHKKVIKIVRYSPGASKSNLLHLFFLVNSTADSSIVGTFSYIHGEKPVLTSTPDFRPYTKSKKILNLFRRTSLCQKFSN